MIGRCLFPVLLLLIPLASGGGLMKDSTCETIHNQLSLIDDTIRNTARNIKLSPFYTGVTVDERLRLLLDTYHNRIAQYQQYGYQVSTFVQNKLKQFTIPFNGLEDNTSLLDKVFSTVEEGNAFHQLQVTEQKQKNHNLTAEIANLQPQLEALEQQSQQLRLQLAGLNQTLAQVETENKKLQAKLHDNPTSVRG